MVKKTDSLIVFPGPENPNGMSFGTLGARFMGQDANRGQMDGHCYFKEKDNHRHSVGLGRFVGVIMTITR